MSGQSVSVLSKYRELLRLISRLPDQKKTDALAEARTLIRARRAETNPEQLLQHQKELSSRIGFLRIVTPRRPGEVGAGSFVVRDGHLVQGSGELKGARVADGTISMEEAHRRNDRDFKRFYGAPKPKSILF